MKLIIKMIYLSFIYGLVYINEDITWLTKHQIIIKASIMNYYNI